MICIDNVGNYAIENKYLGKLSNFQLLLDYDKEPIPDFILKEIQNKYPNDWNDYIKKYENIVFMEFTKKNNFPKRIKGGIIGEWR